MENNTAVVFQLFFYGCSAAVCRGQFESDTVCASLESARRAERPKWRQRARVSLVPAGPGELNAPGCPA